MHPSSDWNISLTGDTWFVWCHKCFTRGDYHMCAEDAAIAWNTRDERTCRPIETSKCLSGTDCPAWLCSECGELFEEGARFCSNCGCKVVNE